VKKPLMVEVIRNFATTAAVIHITTDKTPSLMNTLEMSILYCVKIEKYFKTYCLIPEKPAFQKKH
jgi:hypothetical protein